GYFDVSIPLKICLGFDEDLKKIIIVNLRQLILIRSNTDVNAILNFDNAILGSSTNESIKVQWRVPHVSDAERLTLLKYLEKNIELPILFRSWELHEYPLLPEAKNHTWTIKTSNKLEKPRFNRVPSSKKK
ncbi:hypothetical protein NQ315_003997, partial [Exocentrus adspersus]